jgi:16S rRNA (cytosine1402-N4)-methyltransferase
VVQETVHISVLRDEVLEWLNAEQKGRFLDCTLGGAGHALALLEAHYQTTVVGVDQDARAIARALQRLTSFSERIKLHQGRFSQVLEIAEGERFDGVLADLGLSTDQLREGRGFSFQDTASLDMRMDERSGPTAAELLNCAEPGDLYRLLREGGVGKEARRVVEILCAKRPFFTSKGLADALSAVLTRSEQGSHPATVVFQSLRIAVNEEMKELHSLLRDIPQLIRSGGRLAIISFHSGEDKVVTKTMRQWQSGGEFSARWPGSVPQRSLGKLLTPKAIVPSEEEVRCNPASRSARMRVFEFF